MLLLTPIIVGIMLAGTMGAGSYIQSEAEKTVQNYNLASVGHMLEIYYADHAEYPANLNELVDEGEIKNLNVGSYVYQVSEDLQKVKLCYLEKDNCWNSF